MRLTPKFTECVTYKNFLIIFKQGEKLSEIILFLFFCLPSARNL